MARVPLAQVIEGSLGYFWPFDEKPPNLDGEPERGYAHRDGGWVMIETLEENVTQRFPRRQDEKSPAAIAALMPEASALFLEVVLAGWTMRSGYRASSTRYRARTVINGIVFDDLRSPRLLGIEARFHGISRWAGLTATTEDSTRDSEGLLKSWTVKAEALPVQTHKLSHGRAMSLSAHWNVDGEREKRVISAPTAIGCASHRPRDVWDLLKPLISVQDLLSLACGGFIAADSAKAELHRTPDARVERHPELWNGTLMVPLPGVKSPKSMTEHPLFTFSAIGGLPGLVRWIRLCDTHPRATAPVVNQYRFGSPTPQVLLLEVASAIEYWVRSNRNAAWANGKFTQALASRVGSTFSQWVGDSDRWCVDFWQTYNKIKHEPNYSIDPHHVSDLGHSGRMLLAAALLNRTSGTKNPSRQIFSSHRLHNLGSRLTNRYS